MKKIAFAILAISIVLFSACGNNQGKKKTTKEATKTSIQEQYLTADLKIKLDSLSSSMNKLGMLPILQSAQDGKITLTEKEKKVKPDYLLPVYKANEITTLTQKYRAVMMYRVDLAIAELYGMPTADYRQTIAKLLVDINNTTYTLDINKKDNQEEMKDNIKRIYNEELENGTINFFYEAAVAGIVEQLYILTKNIDKYIVCFDDQAASDVTYRFSLVHDGIVSLIPYHPEMKALDTVLQPLYVINAINVKQLRDQLMELKGEISVIRDSLLD